MKVLDRLSDSRFKLSVDKCQFCRISVTYVGHIVSENGVATDPSKLEAIASWPNPTQLTELLSFLGFCRYYRKFVNNFSAVVQPLTQLSKGYTLPKGLSMAAGAASQDYLKMNEPFGNRWTPKCEEAFQAIKACLMKMLVLALADPQKPYVLHVDASLDGLGQCFTKSTKSNRDQWAGG
ncbi:uncharacterized protein LOC142494712 [Ascaphus truei]|uniref:uncharacterized protein LOC142494712 n=1 Tax=Ascaphus truei TaxID=8439 RepID=UPI003F591194